MVTNPVNLIETLSFPFRFIIQQSKMISVNKSVTLFCFPPNMGAKYKLYKASRQEDFLRVQWSGSRICGKMEKISPAGAKLEVWFLKSTLAVLVVNKPGVLARISGLLSRRVFK